MSFRIPHEVKADGEVQENLSFLESTNLLLVVVRRRVIKNDPMKTKPVKVSPCIVWNDNENKFEYENDLYNHLPCDFATKIVNLIAEWLEMAPLDIVNSIHQKRYVYFGQVAFAATMYKHHPDLTSSEVGLFLRGVDRSAVHRLIARHNNFEEGKSSDANKYQEFIRHLLLHISGKFKKIGDNKPPEYFFEITPNSKIMVVYESFADVLLTVIKECTEISRDQLKNGASTKTNAMIRRIFCVLSREYYGKNVSLKHISSLVLKKPDHATVLYYLKGHENLYKTSKEYSELYALIHNTFERNYSSFVQFPSTYTVNDIVRKLRDRGYEENQILRIKSACVSHLFENAPIDRLFILDQLDRMNIGLKI